MTLMEGTLWKWTNYLSGWQPRFFVLEVGVLAYYKSQEEVGRGSRGSIKMGCCEITVHPTDSVRIDLKIPPDQYIYLRAATSAERQQWLVALGTSKACITQLQSSEQNADSEHSKLSQLKGRMQELSMYRSLLLQQINTIKLMCAEKEDSQEFNEAATMLSATCDEFLKNLCDCMELADANFVGGTPDQSPASKHSAFRKQILHEFHRTNSPPSSPMSSISSSSMSSTVSGTLSSPSDSDKTIAPQPEKSALRPDSLTRNSSSNAKLKVTFQNPIDKQDTLTRNSPTSQKSELSIHDSINEQDSQPPTFFSMAPHKFQHIQVTEDNGIPTKSFLAACSSILPFFDVLGSTAFAPVKIDIRGNINKLSSKFDSDPKSFSTLQNMIYQEIKSNSCRVKNSATDALLWLKRALEFMNIFLSEVVKGSQDLGISAGVAYEKTLRKYHGWVVRGVFALAVKAVPYREDFLLALGTVDQTCAPPDVVIRHMKTTVDALGNLMANLNQFYSQHQLDIDDTV